MMRRRSWLIAAVAVLFWLSLAAWAVSSPVGSSPDDAYHLGMMYSAAGVQGENTSDDIIGSCFGMNPQVPAACSTAGELTVPKLDELVQGHYPPFYYAFASVFVGDTLATTTLHVRLANSLLAVAMALGSIYLTARPLRRAVALSWLVVSVPMAMFFIASINPNSWSIIGIAALWGPLLSLLTAPGGGGATFGRGVGVRAAVARIVFIVLAAFISVGGRTEGALFLPIIAVTLAVFAIPRHPLSEKRLLARLVVPATPVLLSILFLVVFAGSKVGVSTGSSSSNAAPYQGWLVVQHTINSVLGTLGMPGVPGGDLGVYDVPVPAVGAAAAVSAVGGLTLLGLGMMYGRKAIALTLYMSLAFTLIAILWSRTSWEYFQPRYFIPLAFVGVGLALLPAPRQRGQDGREPVVTSLQLFVIMLAAAVANSAALMSTLIRYVHGVIAQPSRDPLNQLAPSIDPAELAGSYVPSWWPEQAVFEPLGVWIAGSLTFSAAVLIGWWLLRRDNGTSADQAILDSSAEDNWDENAALNPVSDR